MKKTREEVVKLMEEFLRVEQGILNLDTCIGGIDEWDSLGHLSILSGLDKAFSGKLSSISNIAGAASVREILDILSDNDLIK
jgi:acyl carrier protein